MILSFNGAVTFSLRKSLNLEWMNVNIDDWLQWGRNFFVTEIMVNWLEGFDGVLASMGP